MALINQIYPQLNSAIQQTWGDVGITIVDEQSLISVGNDVVGNATTAERDIFTGALSSIITDTIYVSRPLTGVDLGISRDENGFNGIKRKVRVKPVLLQHNTEYDLGNQAFNPFEITTPTVDEKVFAKFGTYEVKIFIPDKQLFTAFSSNAEMEQFYSLLYKQAEDAIKRGEWAYDRLALANFIGEKIHLQTTQPNKIHAVNLLEMYNTTFNKTLTAANVYYDQDFLRFFVSIMERYRGLMHEDTDIFNGSDGYPSQTPDEYMNLYVLSNIAGTLPAYLYSDTYNYSLNTLNNYKTVSFWQGIGDTNAFTPANTSAIHINIASDGTEINQEGILAVMMDKDAVATFYSRPNAETWRVPTKGNQYYRANTQEMINDLYENGVVFYVADPTTPPENG